MFKNSSKLCLVAITVLSVNLVKTAQASCVSEIYNSDYKLSRTSQDGLFSSAAIMGISSAISTSGVGALASAPISLGAGALSSTGVLVYSGMDDLSQSEAYAYEVLDQSSVDESHMSATMASFIKGVQREIGQDSNAVIPTGYEVIQEVKQINNDLSACTNENGEFFRTTKESLNSLVVENLTY